MKVTHYHVSDPIHPLTKQYAIWGRDSNTNCSVPLVYLQRPKWIKDGDAWRKIALSIQLKLPKGYEVK